MKSKQFTVRYVLFIFCLLFFVAATVLAQAVVSNPSSRCRNAASCGGCIVQNVANVCSGFMIYYFMIIKPQQLKAKTQADLMTSLKKGDAVVTSSGIFGKVSSVETDGVQIEISQM